MTDTLRVRMYNVGFGDCFLITIPGDPVRAILVDAGYHPNGKGAFDAGALAKQVIADVVDVVGTARVDVVIATHRHADHISAFNAEEWDQLSVGEVWLPWVEDRSIPGVDELWKKQIGFAEVLAGAANTFALSDEDRGTLEFILHNAGFGFSNDEALVRLKTGFKKRDRKKPRYLPAKQAFPERFTVSTLPDVEIHVLGPARDADLIEELDPKQDGETYKKLALLAEEAGGGVAPAPFKDVWTAAPERAMDVPLEPRDLARLKALARGVEPMFAAEKLDRLINSTSLVLVLQIGSARLLLPGDAEWGTWKRILEDDDARALVERTTFLKVGHHGSHNATPVSLVEDVLRKGVNAMISTQKGPGSYRNNIPLPGLLSALDDHGITAVRSDDPPDELPDGYTLGDDGKWIDLLVPF